MAQSRAWAGTLGWRKEAAWGTRIAANAWLQHFGKPSLLQKPTYKELSGTKESRSKYAFVITRYVAEGAIPDIEVVRGEFDSWFELAMGTDAGGGVYTLVDGSLPSATIEENTGNISGFVMMGAKVNTLTLTAKANDTLMASLDLVGKQRLPIPTGDLTGTSYSSNNPWVFWQGVLTVGGSEIFVRSFELKLENNLKKENFKSGDPYPKEFPEGARSVSGSFELDLEDLTHYNRFQTGSVASASLVFTSGANSLTISMPRLVFNNMSIEKDDQETPQKVEFWAHKSGVTKEFTVTIA